MEPGRLVLPTSFYFAINIDCLHDLNRLFWKIGNLGGAALTGTALGMDNASWLLVRDEMAADWAYELIEGEHRLGRSRTCQIRLQHDSVSREHALIVVDECRKIYIRDLHSRNGTLVNEQKIEQQELRVGSKIRLGAVLLEVIKDIKAVKNRIVEDESTTMAGLDSISTEMQAKINSLTEAQRRVLSLLLRGHSEKEAATLLFISQSTVHNHIRQVYQKFDVKARSELMALFLRHDNLLPGTRETKQQPTLDEADPDE